MQSAAVQGPACIHTLPNRNPSSNRAAHAITPPHAATMNAGDGATPVPLQLSVLGVDVQERWTLAVDITPAREAFIVREAAAQ